MPPTLLGTSPAFARTLDRLRRVAPLRQPVLIRGETGTGKELAARMVHDLSPRHAAPFVPLNCGAIPSGLAESELFGHVRGAFTGAERRRNGAFERAHAGTLFLDEVAELPIAMQAKLLRVLETGRICAVGADRERVVDVRVVAATHRDLEAMVDTGTFREDLLHRIGVFELRLPPLRERSGDIPLLLDAFAADAARQLGRPVRLDASAVRAALNHPWSGNVRELKNALLRAAALGEGTIGARDLIASSAAKPSSEHVTIPRGDYASMRRALLEQALAEAGSIRRAARVLGVPRSTLGNWIKRARDG